VFCEKTAGFLLKTCIFTTVGDSRIWQSWGGGKEGPVCRGTYGREGRSPGPPSLSIPVNGNGEERRTAVKKNGKKTTEEKP
jgi:hypothetical protein